MPPGRLELSQLGCSTPSGLTLGSCCTLESHARPPPTQVGPQGAP